VAVGLAQQLAAYCGTMSMMTMMLDDDDDDATTVLANTSGNGNLKESVNDMKHTNSVGTK